MADQATDSRQQLGRELRKARNTAEMTQSAIAVVLGCGQGKINKIETTLVGISPSELDLMLEAYQVPADKADDIRKLAVVGRGSRQHSDLPTPSRAFRHLSDLEPDAAELLNLHSERIPGPLQSEQYMLRQFESYAKTASTVTELMRHRLARTRIFATEKRPRYRVILSESSLHRMPGGRHPELVVDQVEHLLELIRSYNSLALQVLPYDAKVPAVGTDFVVARFTSDEPDFAYIEYPSGGTLLKKRQDLSGLTQHWYELHDAAYSQEDSVKFLDRFAAVARSKWRSQSND